MHGPVIVAVIVHRAMAVEEEAILAVFEGQGAICTQEERTAIFRVRIGLNSPGLWARRCTKEGGSQDFEKKQYTKKA